MIILLALGITWCLHPHGQRRPFVPYGCMMYGKVAVPAFLELELPTLVDHFAASRPQVHTSAKSSHRMSRDDYLLNVGHHEANHDVQGSVVLVQDLERHMLDTALLHGRA